MSVDTQTDQTAGGSGSAPIKALLLDDSALDRTRIRRLSEKSDLPVHFAEVPSIKAMTNVMDREVFDLILVDYHLPVGDGLQALELIRGHASNNQAATIMISGNEQSSVAISAFRSGCHDFLAKDELSSASLQEVMLGALRNAGLGQSRRGWGQNDLRPMLKSLLGEAFCEENIQNVLKDGLRQAAASLNIESEIGKTQDLAGFVGAFLIEDDFNFHH